MRLTLFLVAAALVLASIPSRAAERIFFSVQFAEFKDLETVNRHVNSLQQKEKTVYWEKTTIPDMGVLYRVYLGRFDRWEEALAYGEKLKAAGAVKHFGIHWFAEPEPSGKEGPGRIRLRPLRSSPKEARFLANKDGTVLDRHAGLMWTQNGWRLEFLSAVSWQEAIRKCNEFRLGGHSDWRLPTLDEWQSLIDPVHRNPALVEPNPFVNIISHMPYWSATEYTYGQDPAASRQRSPLETYVVTLYSGTVNHQKKSELGFILPVRSVPSP